jgi:hypothetical protein
MLVGSRVIAERAGDRLRVGPHVSREAAFLDSPINAEGAGIRLLPRVCLEVAREVGLLGCPIVAESAGIRLLPRVTLHVDRER